MKKISLKRFRGVYSNVIIVIVIVVLAFASFFGSVMNAFSQSTLFAIDHGDRTKPCVAFMINVYWGNEYLEKMLSTLSANKIKTTFFVGGCWVASNPELLKKIKEGGHEIGNHGYFHKDHDKISYERNFSEIDLCHKQVENVTEVIMNLFTPPSGAYNMATLECADKLGYKTIMWTKDTIDWRDQNSALIISRATENIDNGSFILMHPTEKTNESLQTIIDLLKKKGFEINTVSKCLGM